MHALPTEGITDYRLIVLPGIRILQKQDLDADSQKQFRHPGEIIHSAEMNPTTHSYELSYRLRQHFAQLQPLPTRGPFYVEQQLRTCSRMFFILDKVRPSLQPPYDGCLPFQSNYCPARPRAPFCVRSCPNRPTVEDVLMWTSIDCTVHSI